jgi:hypothetical protein
MLAGIVQITSVTYLRLPKIFFLAPTGAGIDLRCILEDIHLKLSSHASRVSSPVVAG